MSVCRTVAELIAALRHYPAETPLLAPVDGYDGLAAGRVKVEFMAKDDGRWSFDSDLLDSVYVGGSEKHVVQAA